MNDIIIGLPRGIYYYYYGDILKSYFKRLGFKVVVSPDTNQKILNDGIKYSNDEMCLSLKILLGHIAYLKDRCDYLIVPRIVNYGKKDQTCTNFLGIYDLINNLFDIKIVDFNIDYLKKKTLYSELIRIGKLFNQKNLKNTYDIVLKEYYDLNEKRINKNLNKLNSNKTKVLIVSHPYNLNDKLIGYPIINILKNLNVEFIDSNYFDKDKTSSLANYFSPNLYWKFSKESIGSIKMVSNKINGIIFLSAFPCGLDSLVNEVVIRKLDKPYLNLIIDENYSLTGMETRIESFIDIIEQNN